MIEIVKFTSVDKKALRGLVTVKVPKWGNFIIRDLSYFESGPRRWVSWPTKGEQVDGVIKYTPTCQFESSEISSAFLKQVLDELTNYLNSQRVSQAAPTPRINTEEQLHLTANGVPF